MNQVIWIEQVDKVRGRRVLFDTNVWVMIEGFNEGAPRRKIDAYSSAYDTLLKNENTIVYNDYILNEFCNTCARIEYNNFIRRSPVPHLSFKDFRRTSQFVASMALVRESCLNIIESCCYDAIDAHHTISEIVNETCTGTLDFTDATLVHHCTRHGTLMMTDDSDFQGRGLTIITANRRMLPS